MKVFNGWDFVLLQFKIFSETLDGAFGKGVRVMFNILFRLCPSGNVMLL